MLMFLLQASNQNICTHNQEGMTFSWVFDDIHIIWNCTGEDILEFINKLNQKNKTIDFGFQ